MENGEYILIVNGFGIIDSVGNLIFDNLFISWKLDIIVFLVVINIFVNDFNNSDLFDLI